MDVKRKIKKMARVASKICKIKNIARYNTSNMPRILIYHSFCKTGFLGVMYT